MAKPTKVIHRLQPTEEEKRKQDLREIEDALVENKDAILDTLELMKYVQETELINILKALIAERDEVVENVVTFVDGSELTRSLKNALLLFNTLGQLNVEEMEPLIAKLNGAITQVAKEGIERGGYTSLLQAIKDPDLVEGLNTTLALLKGLGAHHEEQEEKEEKQEKEKGTNPKWVAAATAGASLLALSFLFRK